MLKAREVNCEIHIIMFISIGTKNWPKSQSKFYYYSVQKTNLEK
jgi:hypothetical protein